MYPECVCVLCVFIFLYHVNTKIMLFFSSKIIAFNIILGDKQWICSSELTLLNNTTYYA